jgi:methylmalonyl-CoA epimerase
MIEIKHVDHISMAVPKWKDQAVLMEQLFNFNFLREFSAGPTTPFHGCILKIPDSELQWEILQPSSPQSFVAKFLNERGPGLHHITIEVPSINKAITAMKTKGLQPFGGVSEDGIWKMTYIHPRDSGGVLWQLFEPLDHSRKQAENESSADSKGGVSIDHVCLFTQDLEKQIAWHSSIFGFEEVEHWEQSTTSFAGCRLRMPNSELHFEIISPTINKGDVHNFLQKNGGGLHHIGLKTNSLTEPNKALERLANPNLIDDLQSHIGHSTFITPQQSGGVIFYLP